MTVILDAQSSDLVIQEQLWKKIYFGREILRFGVTEGQNREIYFWITFTTLTADWVFAEILMGLLQVFSEIFQTEPQQ